MMSVYENALTASRTGPTAYVVERGLDILMVQEKKALQALLIQGYQVKAKCSNGVMYQSWNLMQGNIAQEIVMRRICRLLDLENPGVLIQVETSTFYDNLNREEAVYMHLNFWKEMLGKPNTIYITPKDRIADPEGFANGQELAKEILAFLTCFHIPQNTPGLTRELKK